MAVYKVPEQKSNKTPEFEKQVVFPNLFFKRSPSAVRDLVVIRRRIIIC